MFTVHAKAEYKVEYNIVVDVNCQAVISVPFVNKKLLNIKPCIVAHSTTAVGHPVPGEGSYSRTREFAKCRKSHVRR